MISGFYRLLLLLVVAATAVFAASDEAQLRERATRFYQLQIAGDRAEAAKLVDSQSRSQFLGGRALPLTAVTVDRVTLKGKDSAEVEVTTQLMLPLFPAPVSRSFPTPWKKVRGKWYFVVDTTAIREVMSQQQAPQQTSAPPEPLVFTPPAGFGQTAEIRRTIKITNQTSEAIRFKVIFADEDWLDVLNRNGEIPAGESFPMVVVLKQMPRERQTLSLTVEGLQADGRIIQLSIPVSLESPSDGAVKTALQQAIRKYRAEQ